VLFCGHYVYKMNTDYNSQPLEDKNKYQNESEEQPVQEPENKIPFWYENPNVLVHSDYIYELFPSDDMEYAQMLNAITRTTILIAIVMYITTSNSRVIFLLAITLGVIFLMNHYSKKEEAAEKEAFGSKVVREYLEEEGSNIKPDAVFTAPSAKNPFGNHLVTDTPSKKPAPPAYNSNVQQKINDKVKEAIRGMNPDNTDLNEKLYKDLGAELSFEQSLRQFHSTAATTNPNDQEAFAHFCYGSMISCKEGNAFACARNAAKYTNY